MIKVLKSLGNLYYYYYYYHHHLFFPENKRSIGYNGFDLENKRWDFCFAHLRWCHDRWASNILSGGCWRMPRVKYWMPIHYDTIEYKKKKTSHLLFSFLVRIVLFLHFVGRIYLTKMLLHHFISFVLIITPLMKNNVSIQETKIITWCLSCS